VIVDDNTAYGASMCVALRRLGFEVWFEDNLLSAKVTIEQVRPHAVVTELKIGGVCAWPMITELKASLPECRFAIVTAYPSVATAVQSVRQIGVDVFLGKPVAARLLVQSLFGSVPAVAQAAEHPVAHDEDWPSLGRVVWEYLNAMFECSGSMSEAARRLGLDRRSLRRMLAKHPPAR
jgi:two-component system response regulator RegA